MVPCKLLTVDNLIKKICLVIPCYNEAKRLDFNKFKSVNCYYLFVNDGSNDNTLEIIKNNLKDNMFVLDLKSNLGKGEAIRRGFLHITQLPIFNEIDWIGFWDADLAAPLHELKDFILYEELFEQKLYAIWGSRVKILGSNIIRSPLRHCLGRIFAVAVAIVLKVKSYDSQCGAKLFRKEIVDKYFSEPFISRWIFDVELLLRMKNLNMAEYPLKNWKDVSGGNLKVHSIALRTMREIIKLRFKYL